MSDPTPLPCPWCEALPEIIEVGAYDNEEWISHCLVCDYYAPHTPNIPWYPTRAAAIAAWNQRPGEERLRKGWLALRALVAAVEHDDPLVIREAMRIAHVVLASPRTRGRGSMNTDRPFADTIRHRRKALGMTLSELADRCGWTIPKVSALERGADPPPRLKSNIKKLADALGLDAVALERLAEDQKLRAPLF